MPKYFFSMLFLLLSPALLGTNLILNGSFDGDIKASEVRTNGGKFSIFTEELTWNTCGRLEVDRVMTMADGSQQHSAAAWIGATGKLPGFVAKPETTYQFSIEVRGEVQGRASISATCWHGDDIWRDYQRVKTTVEGFVVQKHWTVYKGTFTTTADTKRAALQVQIWENSKHGPLVYKVGDGILFDNVEVSEAKATLLTAAAPPKPELRRQQQNVLRSQRITAKITVDGRLDEPAWQNAPRADGFQVLGKNAPADAATEVRVLSDKEYLYLGITCQEPGTIVAAQDGLGTGIWRDDILEVFFGPISEDRRLSQFAVSAGGGRYLGYGNASNLPLDYDSWEGKTTVGKNSWQAELKVPLRMLSNTNFGASGDSIAFNVARQRKQAKELSTWSPLRESFHEVENYGLLLVADFGAAWKKITGQDEQNFKNADEFADALLEFERRQQQEKYDRLAGRKFAVAPVPVISDFAIPFVPPEVFSPVEEIHVTAAINELKAVPVALANLTDQAAEYQVILETKGRYNGAWGLEGFPPEQFVMRQAVRFKDSDDDPGHLRLDPLPKVNQASTIMVLPREAGLAWLDFDTTGVAPGTYEGRLRIIPLSEVAKWETIKGAYWNRQYTGDMQDIPFTLEVRNITLEREPALPMGFFQAADNELCFQMMLALGVRNIGVSPWAFKFNLNEQGDIDPEGYSESLLKEGAVIKQHEEWARKYGVQLTYFIGFSTHNAFSQVYGVTKKPEQRNKLWSQWIAAMEKCFNSLGVAPERYVIETWDEPHPDKFPELLESHQLAKAGSQKVRLSLTLGAHIMSAEDMKKLADCTDEWTLWSDGYFSRPEHLQLIKAQQQRGVLVRHYTCDTSMRSSLARRYRRNAWFGELHRLDGNEMFHFADTYGGRGASDWKVTTHGGIVYKLFDEYLPSIRYMAMREGMTDVKYLETLRKISGQNQEARNFVEQAAKRVVVDFGHDPTMPDKVREEAAQWIMKLQAEKK